MIRNKKVKLRKKFRGRRYSETRFDYFLKSYLGMRRRFSLSGNRDRFLGYLSSTIIRIPGGILFS